MIEFRWLDAPLMVTAPLPNGIVASIPRKHMLQLRDGQYGVAIKSGGYPPEEQGMPVTVWLGTPWQDVPTVKYEDERHPAAEHEQGSKK